MSLLKITSTLKPAFKASLHGSQPVYDRDTHDTPIHLKPAEIKANLDQLRKPADSCPKGSMQFALDIHDEFGAFTATLMDVIETVGRSVDNTVRLYDRYVSRSHAYLVRVPDPATDGYTYCLFDGDRHSHAASRNGLFVNRYQVKSHLLQAGDIIHFGPTVQAYFYPLSESVLALQSHLSLEKA